MFAAAVTRIVKHRRRRRGTAEWPVVADISPASPRVGLALGQHRHGSVVAMQPFGRQDVGLQPLPQRHQHHVHAPTWSARVDRLSGTPSRA